MDELFFLLFKMENLGPTSDSWQDFFLIAGQEENINFTLGFFDDLEQRISCVWMHFLSLLDNKNLLLAFNPCLRKLSHQFTNTFCLDDLIDWLNQGNIWKLFLFNQLAVSAFLTW